LTKAKTDNKKIIVDINVANCQIRAYRPKIQIKMPNDDASKIMFWNTVQAERLNSRQPGHLRGRALQKAEKIVNKFGSITTSGEYGSIEIDQRDFIPMDMEEEEQK